MKAPVLRAFARRDVDEAIDYYLTEAGAETALSFINAVESAYAHLSRHPGSGSPRYAYELSLPDLRFWPLRGFPYLIFYVELEKSLDIWRVLHAERDIPAWLKQ